MVRRLGGRVVLAGAIVAAVVILGAMALLWRARVDLLAGSERELDSQSVALAGHASQTFKMVKSFLRDLGDHLEDSDAETPE